MRYALDALRRRPGRTTLAALGIGLATALVVALLALAAGIDGSASRLALASGIDLLATSTNTSISGGSFPPVLSAHQLPDGFRLADPNVETASPWLVSDLVYANASLYAAVNASPNGGGVPPAWAPTGASSIGWIPEENRGINVPRILNGPGFTSLGDPHYGNGNFRGPFTSEIVLDQGLAADLKVVVGGEIWTSPRSAPSAAGLASWFANATPFRVVGISAPYWLIPSALIGFLHLSELQAVDGGSNALADPASLILVHLYSSSSPDRDQLKLAAAYDGLTILTIGSILGQIHGVIDLYRTFGTLVGAIGIAVSALFTSAVLLMSVDDRSQEIALLRAIGYPRRTIARLVLEEALLLSGLGLAIGVPLGFGLGVGLDRLLDRLVGGLPAGFSFVSFDAGVASTAILVVFALGLWAAIVPAARAVSVPIAGELRAP